jgi:hypothetical protein
MEGSKKSNEALIRLEEETRASQSLPVISPSQAERSIEGTKYNFKQMFFMG